MKIGFKKGKTLKQIVDAALRKYLDTKEAKTVE